MDRSRSFFRRYAGLAIVLLGIGLVSWFSREKESGIQERVYSFPAMNTAVVLTFEGGEKETDQAFSRAAAAIRNLEKTCSFFDPESELARLNRSASEAPFRCSGELWTILTEARNVYDLSDGAFDPTVRPLLSLWKGGTPPAEPTRKEAARLCGLEKIRFQETDRTVSFPVRGMSLDLGGIAKGRAADLAALEALRSGVVRGIVNIGGNLRIFSGPEAKPIRVGIRDPQKKTEYRTTILLRNEAVSTSGSYERFTTDGKYRYSHILDPRTGKPAEGTVLSATVTAPDAMRADALSTALFLKGPEFAEKICRQDPRCGAVLILNDGQILYFGKHRLKP